MIHGTQQDFFNATDYFIDRNIRQGRGNKIAVYTEFRNYTYNDIQKMVNKTANGLRVSCPSKCGALAACSMQLPPFRD